MINEEKTFNIKVLSTNQLEKTVRTLKEQNKVIGLCHGVFDLLHPGHLRHFIESKSHCDVLIVSITADRFVNKGPNRPIFNEALRSEALSLIQIIDYVVVTDDSTAAPILTLVKPNYYFKGQDYLNADDDVTGNINQEKQIVSKNGGKIFFTSDIQFSSSNLINNFLSVQPPVTKEFLSYIKTKYTYKQIKEYLDLMSDLEIVLIGETIFDRYTTCEALGKSSKDPILCFNEKHQVTYAGGILAIALHCIGLGAKTKVITGLNSKDKNHPIIDKCKSYGIEFVELELDPSPTIVKNRIIDERTGNRIIELYSMDDKSIELSKEDEFITKIQKNSSKDQEIIVADYGHGLIGERTAKTISSLKNFLCINVQLNAGNRGFNSISKYERANFISLNGNEVQLEARRKHLNHDNFIFELINKFDSDKVLITNGSDGIKIFSKEKQITKAPALANFVKDRVGAGDSVFAMASLLIRVNAPSDVIGLLCNLVGAWNVTFIGNEKTLTKQILLKQLESLLK